MKPAETPPPPSAPACLHWRERLTAPAKVNLLLLVGPRRPDGYHEVLSVMAPLDLHDTLEVELEVTSPLPVRPALSMEGGAGTPPLQVGGEPSPAEVSAAVQVDVVCPGVDSERNLAHRALREVAAATGCAFRGRVEIMKRIPTAAGMGGGSSDAAAVLAGAAATARRAGFRALSGGELGLLASRLGADVPFFLAGGCQLASGIGTDLEPIALPSLPLLLVLPEEELSTAAVYRAYDEAVGKEEPRQFRERAARAVGDWRLLEQAWVAGSLSQETACRRVAQLTSNDLERAAYRLVPDLLPRRFMLEGVGASAAMMSGSGPSTFGVFAEAAAAEEAHREAGDLGRISLCTRTLP